MFIFSKTAGTMICHKDNCQYIRRIKKENRGYCYTYEECMAGGYNNRLLEPCAICIGMGRLVAREKRKLIKFSAENNLRIGFANGRIIVDDSEHEWLILFSKMIQKPVLYHKNYMNKLDRIDRHYEKIPGYHRQRKVEFKKSLIKFLQYIVGHRKSNFISINKKRMEIAGNKVKELENKIHSKMGRKKRSTIKKKKKELMRRAQVLRVLDTIDMLQRSSHQCAL